MQHQHAKSYTMRDMAYKERRMGELGTDVDSVV